MREKHCSCPAIVRIGSTVRKAQKINLDQVVQSWRRQISVFRYFSDSPRGGAPFLEELQYQVDAWSGRSKLLFQLPAPKTHLIYCPRIEDVSDIKLIRTDTTLDLSQKAEKRYRGTARRCHRPAVLHVALRVTGSPAHPRSPFLCFVDTTVNGTVLDSRANFLFSTL